MSVKVVLSQAGDVEIVAGAVCWSSAPPLIYAAEASHDHLYLFSDEKRKDCVAEFRQWVGVKKES